MGSRLDLAYEVPGKFGTVVLIVLIGLVSSPPAFPCPSSVLLGCGEALLSCSYSGGALLYFPDPVEAPLYPVECGEAPRPPHE